MAAGCAELVSVNLARVRDDVFYLSRTEYLDALPRLGGISCVIQAHANGEG